jgi:ABC-type transport system involved in multi-copper enzyme maturation permease subunit
MPRGSPRYSWIDTMDAPSPAKVVRINRFLPYWAVLQADIRQSLRSWVYRVWVLLCVLAAAGYIIYRFGAYREAGMIQPASDLMSDLLRWTVFGSVTLIIVLTAGSITSERGTLADSVLSRGISRYQYFLGKWHARVATILGTFFGFGVVVLIGSLVLLRDENLSLLGSLVAMGTVAALLAAIITCGVTISALANSTVLGIAILWLVVYGAGFILSLLPASYPSPDRALKTLPSILRGAYDTQMVTRVIVGSLVASVLAALVGLIGFARRDV